MGISPERVLRLLERDERVLATLEIARALHAGRDVRGVATLLRALEREGRVARARGGWRRARAGGSLPLLVGASPTAR